MAMTLHWKGLCRLVAAISKPDVQEARDCAESPCLFESRVEGLMKLLVLILSLCVPILGGASYFQPTLEEAVGKS